MEQLGSRATTPCQDVWQVSVPLVPLLLLCWVPQTCVHWMWFHRVVRSSDAICMTSGGRDQWTRGRESRNNPARDS